MPISGVKVFFMDCASSTFKNFTYIFYQNLPNVSILAGENLISVIRIIYFYKVEKQQDFDHF